MAPLDREQYERLIRKFLVTLNHACLDATEADLRRLPQIESEIGTYIAEFRDTENDAGQILYNAFAYLDEFVNADWGKVITAAYDEYRKSEQKPPDAT